MIKVLHISRSLGRGTLIRSTKNRRPVLHLYILISRIYNINLQLNLNVEEGQRTEGELPYVINKLWRVLACLSSQTCCAKPLRVGG